VRDESATHDEVFHPPQVPQPVDLTIVRRKQQVQPREISPCSPSSRVRRTGRLRAEQSALTAWEKSAAGIVAGGNEPSEKGGGLTPVKAQTVPQPKGGGKWKRAVGGAYLWVERHSSWNCR